MRDKRYGVFPHISLSGENTGRGYVVRTRPVTGGYAYPYSEVEPMREYRREHAALQYANSLTDEQCPRREE